MLAADWDLLIRLAFEGYSAGSIHMPLCNIRVHGANSSSDMTKAEPSLRLISDALFADSRLPTPLVNQRNQSQANMLTWLSLGFYRAQNAQEGSRLLAEAWGLDPRWQATPSIAADLLVSMAQNERFLGRVDTMTYVLDHLPACAVPVRTHSSAMIAKLQLVEAFERLAVGRIDKGRKSLSAGLKTYPAFATDVQAFMTLLNTYAVQAPNGTAGEFAALVVATLGSDAPVLLSNKSRIIASAALTGAFDDYSSQAWQKVPRQIAHAARRDVKVLRNRGVAAIFVKSLMFAERFGQSRKRQKVDLPS